MDRTIHVRDDARAPTRFRKPRAGALAAAVAASVVVVLAGCGGSTNSSTGAGGTSTSASSSAAGGDSTKSLAGSQTLQADALKYSRCMRSHGVPNFPDPNNGGGLTLPAGVNRNSPAFQSAQKACQSLMPGGAGGVGTSGEKSALTRAQGLSLAKCMRAHGVPNFPDPDASGAIPPGSVDLNSPQVKSAFQRCQPSGSTPAP